MTKLQELRGRLDLLPEKHRLKTIVGKLTEFRDLLADSARAFDAALAQEASVRRVFGEEATAAASDERRRAGKVAKRMAVKVGSRIEAVNESRSRVNEDVIAIKEAAAKAGRDMKLAWQRLLDQRLKPYERLAEVAERLNLKGASELSQIMNGLRGARAGVPGTARQADDVADLLRRLPDTIRRLGLEDEAVRKFLVDSSEGTARLKSFHDNQAIADFVSQHDLWDLFRVSTIPVTGNAR